MSIDPPKTNAKSSTNITGWMVTSVSISGWRLMWVRLRRTSAPIWRVRGGPALVGVRGLEVAWPWSVVIGLPPCVCSSWVDSSLGSTSARWPVRLRKTSSRLGPLQPDVVELDVGLVEPGRDAGERADPLGGRGDVAGVAVDVDLADLGAHDVGGGRSTSPGRLTVTTRLAAPDWSLSSSGVPSAMIRPWSTTTMRSASWSASSRYWVVRNSVVPSRTRSRRTPHSSTRLRGSSPVVGSSRKSTGGVAMRLAARSSRRRMPPE